MVLMGFSLASGICYGQTAEDYYDKGVHYGIAGQFEEARERFRKTLEADPFYGPAKECLGIIEDVLKGAIESETALHLFRGVSYYHKELYDEAIAVYRRAIALAVFPQAHNNLGRVYYYKQMYDEAIAAFEEAIEIEPRYAKAYYNLAVVYYEKRDYELAAQYHDKAIEFGYTEPGETGTK